MNLLLLGMGSLGYNTELTKLITCVTTKLFVVDIYRVRATKLQQVTSLQIKKVKLA